jgi:uncharacterized protein YxeA
MKKILIILFVTTTLFGCVSTYEQMRLAIGRDTTYLVKTMGVPDRKEQLNGQTIWIYENRNTANFPDRTVKTVSSYNKNGIPTRTEAVTYKGSTFTWLRYKYYFINEENIVVDVDYGSRQVESSY